WVDHPGFDIHRHLRRITLPAPGTEAQFRQLVGELWAARLARSNPLWELILVEGFEAARFAIVYKTHHAMADGISAVDIGMLLFDVEPTTAPPAPEQPWKPHRSPTGVGLIVRAATGVVATLRRCLRWLTGAARDPADASRRTGDGLIGLWEVTWNLLRPAPKLPINPPGVGPRRDFAWRQFDL